MIQVKKRDGGIEPWSDDKVLTSIIRSGLEVEEAKKVLEKIKTDIQDIEIESIKVKELVYKNLKENYPQEADMYINYNK